MIGRNLKQALTQRIAEQDAPILSLYLDVNPANADNTGNAAVLRAAAAMRGAGLGKEYIAAISARLSQEYVIAKGRTLVVFAGQDPSQEFDAYYLQTHLPLLGRSDGALAHWGRPFVAPLLFVLDQRERYAAIYVSADRVRVFEVFLGQIDEVSDHIRLVDTGDWQPYRHARRSPGLGAGVAARGGADHDSFRDRMREASARLYRTLLPELEKSLKAEGVERVVLLGTPSALAPFQEALSAGMRGMVVDQLPPPANPDAAAHDWLPPIQQVVDRVEAERELALLDAVHEKGVWGLQQTLTLLQDRRLRTVIIPWDGSTTVFRADSGRVGATAEEATALDPLGSVSQVALLEVLPDLAAAGGTVLEFVDGQAQQRLLDEFAGIAGVLRG